MKIGYQLMKSTGSRSLSETQWPDLQMSCYGLYWNDGYQFTNLGNGHQGPLLLTGINLNLSMDE